MKTKTPYLKFLPTLAVIALGLLPAALGGGTFPDLISVAPQPFWTTLNLFRSEPKVSLILLAPTFVTQVQPDYAAASGIDFSALSGLSPDSDPKFTPLFITQEKTRTPTAPVNADPGYTHKSSSSSGQSLADHWSQVAGVGSTIPAYSTGFGVVTGDSSVPLENAPQNQMAGTDVRPSDRSVTPGTSLVSKEITQQAPLAGPDRANQSLQPTEAISIDSITTIADGGSKFNGIQRTTPQALSIGGSAPDAVASTFTWTGSSAGAWLLSTNWSPTGPPGTTDLALFAAGNAATSVGINMAGSTNNGANNEGVGEIQLTGGGVDRAIGNSSTTFNGTLTLNGVGGVALQNSSTNSLTLQNTAGGGNKLMSVVFGNSGLSIDITGTGGITISSVIAGSNGFTKSGTGAGILTLSGANTYSGGTTISAGTVALGNASALGTGGLTINGGLLDLKGFSIALPNLSGSGGQITNANTNTATTLTVGSDNTNTTFGGQLADGTGQRTISLVKTGTGVLTLSGANANNNTNSSTTINGGVLRLNNASALPTTLLTINGGVLELQNPTSFTRTVGSAAGQVQITGGTSGFSAFGSTTTINLNNNGSTLQWGSATFNPTALVLNQTTATAALNFQNGLDLNAANRTINVNANTATVSGAIVNNGGGTAGLIKGGAGTLTLSGANIYIGATTVSAGILKAGVVSVANTSGAFGNNSAVTLANTAGVTLDITGFNTQIGSLTGGGATGGNVTLGAATLTTGGDNTSPAAYGGVISGTGGVTKIGTGTQVLSGANQYSGNTSVNAGALIITNNSALGTTAGGTAVASGAVLGLDGTAGNLSIGTEALTLNGIGLAASPAGALRNIAGANSWAGTIALGSASTITSSASTLTLTGGINNAGFLATFDGTGNTTVSTTKITGSGALTKNGAGTLTLSFANDYTGLTNITAGTLTEGVSDAIGSGAVTVGGGTFDIGANSDTVGTVTLTSGNINGSGGTLTGSSYAVESGSISAKLGGAGVTLTKATAGTVTLNGANTYTGLTTVSAGILAEGVNNAIASGDLTVNGATAIFDLGANHTDVVGTVTLDGGGAINGTGTSALTSTGTFEMKSGTVNAILAGTGIALNKTTSGTVTLNAANFYSGLTTVSAGTLAEGSTGSLVDNSNLTVNGATAIFDLGSNHSDTVGTVTLDGGGTINGTGTSSLFSGTLTFAMKDGTVNAILAGTGDALNKTTSGTVTLNGVNTYTGGTTISGGILALGNATNTLLNTGAVNVGNGTGGTLDLLNHTDTIGALTLNIGTVQSTGGAGTLTTSGVTVTGSGNTISSGATVNGAIAQNASSALTVNGTAGSDSLAAGSTTLSGTGTVGAVTMNGSGNSLSSTGNLTTGGITVNGTSNTIASGIISGAITQNASSALTVNGTAGNDSLANLATLNGTGTVGTVTLAGNNTLSSSGTLTTSAITVNGTGNSISTGAVSGNITQTASSALTVNGTASGSDSLATGATLAGTGTISGAITLAGNNTLSSSGTLTGSSTLGVSGTGNAISSGTVSIAGLTTIDSSAGLAVNSILNGAGAVSVNGTLSGTGTVSKLVTVNSGGHLAPGNSIGTLTLGSLTLSTGSILDYEFGVGNDFTNVTSSGGLTLNGGGFNLYQDGTLNAFSTNGVYNLIGYTGSFFGSLSNLSVLNQVFGKSYTFGATGTDITLTIGANATPATAYWQGSINSAWNATSGLLTNFTTDLAGNTNANQLVGATTNVFFTANGGTQVTTTLGQDFTINSLTFNGNATNTSNISGNTLTLNAGSGDGITVDSGSGAHTISSNVALGADQTWTNNSATTTLTVSGVVSGGFDLTKAGIGTIAFTGSSANTYSGLTTVSAGELDLNKSSGVAVAGNLTVAGGTAQLLGNNQIATGSTVAVSGGTLAMQTFSNTVAGVQLASGAITGAGGTLTSTSNFDVQSGSASAILGGGVGLTKSTSGTVTLTGANTYTGATTIATSGGTLIADAANALGGTSGITVNGGGTLLISNNVSTNHVNNTAPVSQAGGTIAISTGVSEGAASTVIGGVHNGTSVVGLGALTLTANSTLDFDSSGDGTLLVFSLLTSNNFVLTIAGYNNLNFDGTLNSGLSSDDRLVFATSQAGNFNAFDFGAGPGVNVGQIFLDNGFYEVGTLTPVPEPSTWAAAALALAAILWTQRRRFIRNPSFVPIA